MEYILSDGSKTSQKPENFTDFVPRKGAGGYMVLVHKDKKDSYKRLSPDYCKPLHKTTHDVVKHIFSRLLPSHKPPPVVKTTGEGIRVKCITPYWWMEKEQTLVTSRFYVKGIVRKEDIVAFKDGYPIALCKEEDLISLFVFDMSVYTEPDRIPHDSSLDDRFLELYGHTGITQKDINWFRSNKKTRNFPIVVVREDSVTFETDEDSVLTIFLRLKKNPVTFLHGDSINARLRLLALGFAERKVYQARDNGYVVSEIVDDDTSGYIDGVTFQGPHPVCGGRWLARVEDYSTLPPCKHDCLQLPARYASAYGNGADTDSDSDDE